ncbi:MAG: aminoglycoside 3'-phosphotransferase [Clostridia bacterium]|nr:aminoglycoside 3'-phosphotransferase [Clostridia bacterium]
MKRILIDRPPDGLPEEFRGLVCDARIYDSSCSPQARVYYIDRDGGYYLKSAAHGSLRTEAEMDRYFFGKGLGAEVLGYVSGDKDWLLTARVKGEDCTYGEYLASPARLCDILAERLRMLHELDCSDCPVPDRVDTYLTTAELNYRTGNFDRSQFPDSFGYKSADEAYDALQNGKSALKSNVLIHGDYCLPNIVLDNWRFSGFIDLGNGGVGDRHIDIFWAVWTLWFNLKTDKYTDRFFDVYGRDKIENHVLKTVAAAEVFG